MGMFEQYKSDMQNASTSRPRWEYITPGRHVLMVTDLRGISTKKAGACFLISFEVVESDTLKPGAKVDHPIFMSQDFGPRNAKDFLVALLGLDGQAAADQSAISSEDWGAVGDLAIAKPETFRNRLVKAYAYEKQNAKLRKGETELGTHVRTSFSPHDTTKAQLAAALKKGK